jgi:hypothetical protein
MSRTLLEPVETIGAKVSVSTWETIILVELPKRVFTCSGSMISTKLGSPDGGEKEKVVLVGSDEGPSGLASCPTTIDVSIFCSIVLPVLVSSETSLALWVELTPIFRYRSVEFMGGVFLPPKRLEGTLIRKVWFGFNVSSLWVPRFVHERKKRKTTIGFGGTCYNRCAGSYLSS